MVWFGPNSREHKYGNLVLNYGKRLCLQQIIYSEIVGLSMLFFSKKKKRSTTNLNM